MGATSERRRKRPSKAAPEESHEGGSPPKKAKDEQHDDSENVENNAPNTATRQKQAQNGNELVERSQIASPIRIINPRGKPAECGIIKKVYVENFMCHQKLSVDLNRNINFIHGQNGSGKSAILAAIQICLGAGAKRTHRASNLKELVRKETATGSAPMCAKVRVTLLNRGTDGFKPDIFGGEITVERTIALNGGYNGFRLLDEKGVVKSQDKKELYEMLDFLNIQVENPVAILDQEEAKKFLTGKASDKYNFFMKACELERIERTYSASLDRLEEIKESHQKVLSSCTSSLERVDRLKAKYDEHRKLEDLQQKIQELNVLYAWAVFSGLRVEHEAALEKMRGFAEKAVTKQEELTQAEEAANGNSDESREKSQRIKDLSDEAGMQAELKQKLEAELKEAYQPKKAKERELGNILKRKQMGKKAVLDAKKKLQQVREEVMRQSGSNASEEAERAEALLKAEAELDQAKEKSNPLRQEYSDARQSVDETESRVGSARQATRHIQQQLSHAERTLQGLESAGSNSMAMFGPRASVVAKMVEEAKLKRRFVGPVEGPIGAHLKIVPGKENYAELAELALGFGTLDRFVVTDDRDRKLLQDIRRKAGCQQDCGIFQIHNSPRYQVPPPPVEGVETVASVLSIVSDLVFNCLVDNCRIEKIGLGTSKNDSQERLLTTDQSGRQVVRGGKVSQVYFLPRGDMWQLKGGSISLISNEKRLRKTISADQSEAIESARRECEQHQAQLEQAKVEEHLLEGDHNKASATFQKANRARQANDKKVEDLMAEIDRIKAEMENAAPNNTVDTSIYEDDVQQREEELAKLEEDAVRMKREIDEMQPPIEELQSKIHEVNIRSDKVLQELTDAESAMTQYLETQSQKKDAIQKKREKLEKYNHAMSMHQDKINEIAGHMDKARHSARVLHYRLNYTINRRESRGQSGDPADENTELPAINPSEEDLLTIEEQIPPKDEGYYESRLKQKKQKLESEREKRKLSEESMAEAYQAYITAQQEIAEKQQEVERLGATINDMHEDLRARVRRWRQFRKVLDDKVTIKFSEMLALNKYEGDLKFCHDKGMESLDLIVQKSGTAETQTNDAKALSGGERSFTTMCLLIALGESLETPFRIMDEFDVFLDPHVRKITIQSLIHVAKQMEHRQFIFITPQDLTGINPDPQLKILKLQPPARHNAAGASQQQTLDFSQQG